MRISACILWVWLLGCVINTIVTGAPSHHRRSQIDSADDFTNLDKILLSGGRECFPHSQPWQAALLYKNQVSCGGVLVHPQWVLSSAQCFNTFDSVGLGLHSLDPCQEPGSQIIRPSVSVPHPYYNHLIIALNNIMLIKLSKPAIISDTVKPIAMASHCPVAGTKCLMSGWGLLSNDNHPKFLQCLDTRVVSTETCTAAYPSFMVYKMACTDAGKSKGGYLGDSGSPLVCNGELQGIFSGGLSVQLGKPDVHVSVCKYKKWIEDNIKVT